VGGDAGEGLTVKRLLLCVDGSIAGMQAARLAVRLAVEGGGEIRAVCATSGDTVAEALDAIGPAGASAAERLKRTATAVLARVEELARSQGVPVEPVLRQGEPFVVILDEARRWQPDLLVIGRTGRRGPASTVLGSVTAHLLEFTEWPVVVVPASRAPVPRREGEPGRS
jgi:nucleotide-binding universal stress UspA family protein